MIASSWWFNKLELTSGFLIPQKDASSAGVWKASEVLQEQMIAGYLQSLDQQKYIKCNFAHKKMGRFLSLKKKNVILSFGFRYIYSLLVFFQQPLGEFLVSFCNTT